MEEEEEAFTGATLALILWALFLQNILDSDDIGHSRVTPLDKSPPKVKSESSFLALFYRA